MQNDRLFHAFLSFSILTSTRMAMVSHIVKLQLPNAPLYKADKICIYSSINFKTLVVVLIVKMDTEIH